MRPPVVRLPMVGPLYLMQEGLLMPARDARYNASQRGQDRNRRYEATQKAKDRQKRYRARLKAARMASEPPPFPRP